MQMGMFIKENGLMIWQMVKAYSWTQQEQSTQAHGSMIYNMDLEKKVGTMLKQSTLDSSIKERRMGKEGLSGRMEVSMMETLLMGISKVKESTTLLT